MKILMVNDYTYKIAGTEIYMFSIIEELRKKGHEVVLFSSQVTPEEYYSPLYNKSFMKYMQRMINITYYFKFKRIISDFNPDIIHIHNIYNEITPSILWNLNNIVILMTVHGSQMVSPVSIQTERTGRTCKEEICEGCINCVGLKGYLYESVKKNIYKKLLKNITLYITPSNYLQSVLEQKQYSPVIRIYNGIKLLKFSKITYTKHLLYVGRLTKEKGIDMLLEAMEKLVKIIPEIHLTIVGEGNYTEYVRETIRKLRLEKHVTLQGPIASSAIQAYYDNASILMIPSIYPDNLPTVGLEALSVGRPIIGSHIGGISEIIKNHETGILTKPGNSTDIAHAVSALIKNKDQLDHMGLQARTYAEKQFDIKNHIKQLESLYKNVLAKKKL